MAERQLDFLKRSVPNLKEQLARKTLRNVRSQGHPYVDLRVDGRRFVYFCTLCLAPCYSESVLHAHLGGNLHKKRYSAAKATLIGQNPWPFNDGVLFFYNNSNEDEKDAPSQSNVNSNLLNDQVLMDDLAIVVHCDIAKTTANEHLNEKEETNDEDIVCDEKNNLLVIPGVKGKEEVKDLHVRLMGHGKISARFLEKDGVQTGMHRIWCEWLGKRDGANHDIQSSLPSHDFAIVTFGYYLDLGKDDIKTLLLTGPKKRRKKSFSDSEDASETLSYHCYSSGEDSQALTTTTSSALLLHHYDEQHLLSRINSSKTLRRRLRKQQRVASEKLCDICKQKMLPGKDVATLLNLRTGRLACSSRNVHGGFHVFHTSCLVHWILLCEYEMFVNPPVQPKAGRKSRKRTKSVVNPLGEECRADNSIKRKLTTMETEEGTFSDHIHSVFCPDCQGTGLLIEGDALERPTFSLSKVFQYKICLLDAHRDWMKCPEELENCSTGFAFAVQVDDAKDTDQHVAHLKVLQFYRTDEEHHGVVL